MTPLSDLTVLEKMRNGELPRMCSQSADSGVTYLRTGDDIYAGVNTDRTTSSITKFTVGYFTERYLSADRASESPGYRVAMVTEL